jgi:1-acyl-sn-glycerol-3-phosphate acyltransferase
MKKVKDVIISVVLYITAFLAFSLGSLLMVILSFFFYGDLFHWLLKGYCGAIAFFGGNQIILENDENCDPHQQYIIMMNHVNFFDGFVFYSRYPGYACAMEEESHFKWPIYGLLLKRIGFIPVNRKSGRKAMEALKRAGEFIRQRKKFSVVILPEGTRTRTGKLGNFKKGGFLVALESGLDILPIIQLGSYQVKRKNHWLIRPGKVRYIIEKPISTKGYTKENIKELMDKTRAKFLEYVEYYE